ncbi:MAG: hypothetical protein G01um101438_199 [Parcubacteria group bacterium Gr01-1014_38]|nr:MAG: hypothetical protein G01um101438_199 [Parcubacteria group bacterium Gr01-1014_38]
MQALPLFQAEARRRVLVPLALCALALIGALLLIGTHLPNLRTSVLGLGGDPYQTLWRSSAFTEALSRRTLTIADDPVRNFGPLPWIPLHGVFGDPLGYNLVWILQFPLTALATYGLARRLGIARGPAAVAGFLTAFAPYRIAQSLGHFGAMQLFWIPLSMAALLWLLQRPSLPRTLVAAAAFVGTSWTEHMLFLATLLAAALTIAIFWHQAVQTLRTRQGIILALTFLFLVGALGMFPFREELKKASRADSAFNLGSEQRRRFAPTVETILSPPTFHLFRHSPNRYGTPRQAVADYVHTLGLLAPVVAVVGVRRLWREGRWQHLALLGSLVVAGLLLAFAPRTSLGAQLYDEFPVFSAVRTVNRFLVLPALALPLLASIGVSRLPRAAAFLLAGALVLEILPSTFPVQEATISQFSTTLTAGPAGLLLEIPAATDYLVASRAQYASTVHRRRILASNVFERVQDRAAREAPLRVPVVGALLAVRPDDFERSTLFGQMPAEMVHAALASERVIAVIIHEYVMGMPTLRSSPKGLVAVTPAEFHVLHRLLRGAGLHAENVGEGTTLYRVPPWPETTSALVGVPGSGWDAVPSSSGDRRRVKIQPRATFSIRVLGGDAVPATLSFRVLDPRTRKIQLQTPTGPAPVTVSSDGTAFIPLGTLAPGSHAFSFSIDGSELFVENPSVRKGPR